MRFDPTTLAGLRADLMRRGATLAALLTEVLAGKRPPQIADLIAAKPGKRPEEVLRLALDQVEARRKLIDAGDDRYGRCDHCRVELGLAALGEMPWADRCAAHSAVLLGPRPKGVSIGRGPCLTETSRGSGRVAPAQAHGPRADVAVARGFHHRATRAARRTPYARDARCDMLRPPCAGTQLVVPTGMANQVRLALHSQDPLARAVGKLCVGGDWACANGDLEALGDIASRLVTCTPEPLHCELSCLSELCRRNPDQATGAWVQIKIRVLRSVAPQA